jgi:MoxR-like ATPase
MHGGGHCVRGRRRGPRGAGRSRWGSDAATVYALDFLLERPLLRALRHGERTVLLIDELDRADDEFDAFLLEMLSDFTVTIPELGTIAADVPPLVVITSNRTRELHDALTRRCLYHWIDYPGLEREVEIIARRAPEVSRALAESVAHAVARLRGLDLIKPPGAAEAIDWARSLAIVGAGSAPESPALAAETIGAAVKNHDDLRSVRAALPQLLHG